MSTVIQEVEVGDPVEGIGNSDHIVVTCGSKPQ